MTDVANPQFLAAGELADQVEQYLDQPSNENRDAMEEALGRYREAQHGS